MIEFTTVESLFMYGAMIVLATLMMSIANRSKNFKYVFLILVFLIITVPSMFRYNVGIDYKGYFDTYNLLSNKSSIAEAKKVFNIESSFIYLSMLSRKMFHSPIMLFATYSILTNFFVILGVWYFRKDVDPAVEVLVYLTLFYPTTLNIARQSLAVAIIFWGFKYVIERKPIKYMLCVFIAFIFHRTACIAIILYFYCYKRNIMGKIARIFNYVGPVIIVFFLQQMLNIVFKFIDFGKYSQNYHITSVSFGLGAILQLIFLLVFLYSVKNRNIFKNEATQYMVKQLVILQTILMLLNYKMDNFSGRIAIYFQIASIVALAAITKARETKNIFNAPLIQVFPYIYVITLWLKCMIYNEQGQLPYIFRIYF